MNIGTCFKNGKSVEIFILIGENTHKTTRWQVTFRDEKNPKLNTSLTYVTEKEAVINFESLADIIEGRTLGLKFIGIDSWNRPIFKDVNNKRDYYGATDILFDYEDTAELVLNKISPEHITFFGNSFNCEPMGTPVSGEIKFINPNI